MNKKYGIAAIIAGVIIVGVLIFTYGSNSTNSVIQNQQSSVSNSIIVHPSTNTTGRHFFAGVNETVTIKTTP